MTKKRIKTGGAVRHRKISGSGSRPSRTTGKPQSCAESQGSPASADSLGTGSPSPKAEGSPTEGGALPNAEGGRDGVFLGIADDYLSHLEVLTLTLKAPLLIHDMIHIKGHSTNIIQPVDSIQVDHCPVQEAHAGQRIGIKCACRARRGDAVYKICPL